ncbi:MAG: glycogen/starch synthase [Patescibacteria group bacterium]
MTGKKLKIIHIVSEVSPYSKFGGLGDVGYALPKAIARLGHEVIVATPYFGSVRKKNLKKETIDRNEYVNIAGKDYPVSYRKFISPDGLPIYFIVNEELFGSRSYIYSSEEDESLRWIFFNLASIQLLKTLNFQPDIIHCHDWLAGLVPNFLKTEFRQDDFFRKSALVFTIHNLNHQGAPGLKHAPENKVDKGVGSPPVEKNYRKYINFAKRGIMFAHVINTVSERYAKEILTPKFGAKLDPYLKRREDRVFGIINGIDYEVVNPAYDRDVYHNYDFRSLDKKQKNKEALQKEVGLTINKTTPLIGVINRLSEQKGFALIMESMPTLLNLDLQIVVVASGDRDDYLKFFKETAKKHPDKVGIYSPFTQKMASRVYAGSDLYLMPSRYEPCGLSQLISLRYGSIPIVHSVGGLHDTITDFDPMHDCGNGFTFANYEKDELLVAISRAIESFKHQSSWIKLVYRAMKQSFSWELPAKKYVDLYQIALKNKGKA